MTSRARDRDPTVREADHVAVVADGIDEYVDKMRLKMLYSAHEKAAKQVRNLPAARLDARGSRERAKAATAATLRGAVETYIYEAEPLFGHTEIGVELWTDAELGPVPLFNAVPGVEWRDAESFDFGGRLPDGVEVSRDGGRPMLRLRGIRTYLDYTGTEIRVTSEQDVAYSRTGTTTETDVYELWPSAGLSRDAYRATNLLLSELGIGISAEIDDVDAVTWDAEGGSD